MNKNINEEKQRLYIRCSEKEKEKITKLYNKYGITINKIIDYIVDNFGEQYITNLSSPYHNKHPKTTRRNLLLKKTTMEVIKNVARKKEITKTEVLLLIINSIECLSLQNHLKGVKNATK